MRRCAALHTHGLEERMRDQIAPLPQGPWYRVKEVAEIMDVSLATAYAVIDSGELRAYAIGNGRGTKRVAHADLADYMQRCAVKAVTAAPAEVA